jgi:hypothetical protein
VPVVRGVVQKRRQQWRLRRLADSAAPRQQQVHQDLAALLDVGRSADWIAECD